MARGGKASAVALKGVTDLAPFFKAEGDPAVQTLLLPRRALEVEGMRRPVARAARLALVECGLPASVPPRG
jgi:hypothetical protein